MTKFGDFIFKWGPVIGSIATTLTVIILVLQTNILETQFKEKDRPWIGFENFVTPSNNTIAVNYNNFGSVPNTDGKIFEKWSNTPITRDSIMTAPDFTDNLGVDLPNQLKHEIFPTISESILKNVRNGSPLYLGVIFSYNYTHDEHGEFGVISQYSSQAKEFWYKDNWAK